MKSLIQRVSLVIAFFGLVATSAAFAQTAKPKMKTISIVNKCKFDIHEIYLSDVSEDKWGKDLLDSNEVLKPGESIDVEIECGEWDAKLVAGDESTCIVPAVDVCTADIWNVTADCGKEE
jgi:hypothetical protein